MAELPAPRPSADDVLEVACQEFVELVTEHLEGALPEPVDRAVRAHLELCDPCVVYLEQVRGTAAALRALPVPTLPDAARERLLDVYGALHAGRAGRDAPPA
ncbi:zf-HC2 domain-containing protein [Geodermatophilus sp. SYSU D00684]